MKIKTDIFLFLVGNRACIGIFSMKCKAVNIAFSHRVENAVAKSLVSFFKLLQELLHILSLRGVILGAKTRQNGEILASCEVFHVLFLRVDHWAD